MNFERAYTTIIDYLQTYMHTAFWQQHGLKMGILFLLGATFIPRITIWFAVATPFGWLMYVGWVIAPHITVAYLAYKMYWNTNPELVLAACVAALSGTQKERVYVEKLYRDNKSDIDEALLVLGKSIIVIFIGIFILSIIAGLFGVVIFALSSTNAIIACVILILILGSLLYFFRQRKRVWYGVFEVISALFLGGFTIAHSIGFKSQTIPEIINGSDSLAKFLALSSSIYILVRGLDNIGEENLRKLITKLRLIKLMTKLKIMKSGPPTTNAPDSA